MANDRILITGATGFVGRHLVPHLRSKSRDVILAVRSLEGCPTGWKTGDRVRLVETGPIETFPGFDDALAGVATVIHLAGLAHVTAAGGRQDDAPFMAANATATARLVDAAARAGVRTFINLSSLAAITGNASRAVVDDDTDVPPLTAYGRSKRSAEASVLALRDKGVFAVSLRPPLIVGPDARGNWGALQRLAATGLPLPFASVRNARSMVGVQTVVEAICHLCDQTPPVETGGNYALADPEALSLPEIVTELRAGMGRPARLVAFPPQLLYGAAALLGQRPRAAGLLGTLKVDSRRFRSTFAFAGTQGIRDAIRSSGKAYRADTEAAKTATP